MGGIGAIRQSEARWIVDKTGKNLSVVPPGFQSVNLYLIVEGAGRLLEFAKQAFGAEVRLRVPRPDGSIMHSEVQVGDVILEAGDAGGEWKPMPANLHYYVKDVDQVYRQAIQAGAKSLYDPRDMEYGDREAGVRDACGNNWFIATHKGGTSYRPVHFKDVTIGLSLKDAAGFVAFAEKAFGAAMLERNQGKDGTLGHGVIRLGDTTIELSEAHGEWAPRPVGLHYYVEDCDGAFQRAAAAGATILSEPQDKPYGERSGGAQDPWRNHWYIATRTRELSQEELDRFTNPEVKSAE